MSKRLPAIATTVALATVVAVTSAGAATVELRVAGANEPAPLFSGSVTTLPHPVDGGDGSGPHACAGPPGATPSATATGALDDAMRAAGIPWRGNWDPSFGDFFVDLIGPHASVPPDRYWSLTVNGRFASGGCLAQVETGDSIDFTYGTLFGATPPLPPDSSGETDGGGAETPTGARGAGPTATRIREVAARAAAFLRRSRAAAGAEWGRLALALRSGKGASGAALALMGDRVKRLRTGMFRNDVNATAIAVLGLADGQPRTVTQAARWLASIQDRGGGFGYRPGSTPDVDTTGLASWALARAGMWVAAHHGAAFIHSAQASDGGFPSLPGGVSNAQSTGLALVGLRVGGLGPQNHSAGGRTPLDYLASLARPDGSIAYGPGPNGTPVWTTAQALLGLTSRTKLLAKSAWRSAGGPTRR